MGLSHSLGGEGQKQNLRYRGINLRLGTYRVREGRPLIYPDRAASARSGDMKQVISGAWVARRKRCGKGMVSLEVRHKGLSLEQAESFKLHLKSTDFVPRALRSLLRA